MKKSQFPAVRFYMIPGIICLLFLLHSSVHAQVEGPHEIKWLRVGSLHNWVSNAGAEIEYGRRTRDHLEDQTDGLRFPADFLYQDHSAAKCLRIGTSNYYDPLAEKLFAYKIVGAGPREANLLHELMPVEFKMLGKFPHPMVIVDGLTATDNDLNDVVDDVDPDLFADRVIINKLHSSIGVSVTRKIYAFSQQYNDNFFIYDYTFKNTGIIDLDGTVIEKTLTDVYFHLQYRYAYGYEAFRRAGGWNASGNISWGRNTVNQVVGQNPNAADFEFRAQYSWYGPHSDSPGYEADWGAPNHRLNGLMAGAAMAGTVVLHADTSPQDNTDDLSQPKGTQYVGSDDGINGSNQYDKTLMTKQFEVMRGGHPTKTHAEEVGDTFADRWGVDPGGYSQCQSFGPYTLAPGDSIHIVVAEAVGGLDRRTNMRVGKNWYENNSPYTLPDGSTTTDRDAYKKAWVWTCEDSLLKAFRQALDCYQNNYEMPQPPPPPNEFVVLSQGNQIHMEWDSNAESWPNFDGYQIYRAMGRPDTLYDKVFSCSKTDVVNFYDDKTAIRGFNYFYYIQSKDDGSTNSIKPGEPLVSNRFYTMTNEAAYLRRPAVVGTLDSLRVVPNPYHINATRLQFGQDLQDRIMFYGLPAECSIKIFTERGDLIKTFDHADGTSDEAWDSTTSSNQIIVSGLYIALIETPEGEHAFCKFVVIR